MEKKQSSIDWLVNVVQSCIAPNYIPQEIIEQAKAMHKEEIEDAYCKAGLDIAHNDSIKESGLAQEYYIETFGGDDE